MCPDTCKGSTPVVPRPRLTRRCSRTAASVAELPLASAAERQYRWADESYMPSDDSFLRLADAVFAVLKESPPLKAKEIAAHLRRSGWGYPRANVINKVLTQ